MMNISNFVRRWRRREDGSATIEFCLWFPFFIMILGSAIEASLITTRQAMLIGALDRTVRDLQLGILDDPSHADLKTEICNKTGVIPNCTSTLHIELERISTTDFAIRTGQVQCVDVDEETEPALNYQNNDSPNDLMLITVCAAIHPMVPVTGLGLSLPKINDGSYYALVAFSAYVVEPV